MPTWPIVGSFMQSIHTLVADQFNAVNTLITETLTSEVGLVEDISHYLVNSVEKSQAIGDSTQCCRAG